MLIDSNMIFSAVKALEAYRNAHDATHELREGDNQRVVADVLRQEQDIRAMLPVNWGISYDAPFYQINLFR